MTFSPSMVVSNQRIVDTIRRELEENPGLAVAARGGTLVVVMKLDLTGSPEQIQLKIDRPRRSVR